MEIINITLTVPSQIPVSRQKLRKMFKYLSKKEEVELIHYYNNSLNMYRKRNYKGKIIKWEVTTTGDLWWEAYRIDAVLLKDGEEIIIEEYIPHDAYFTGLGKIEWCNSGPYCGFYANF